LTKARSPWSVLFLLLVAVVSAPTRVLARNQPDAAPSPADPAPGTSSVAALVKQGNEARRAGQMRVAIASFRKARDLAPHTYEIRILLADTLRRAGQWDRSLPEYEAARRIDPSRPEGYSGTALISRLRYDYDGAAAVLLEGLGKVAPGSRPDLLLVLAESRRRQSRLPDAQRLFEEILKARPQEAPARAGLARVAEDRGDLAGAIRGWDAYLEIKTEDEAAELRRQELRELRASIEALRETAGRAASAGVLAELGRLQSVAGDAKGAVESYRRALRVDAEHVEARRGLALALLDTGPEGVTEAAREFRRLLKRIPGDGVALYNLVALAAAAGDASAEESAWGALVAARPDDLFALRGDLAFLERQGPEALARALDRGPAGGRESAAPALLRRRALLLATAGRFPEATDALFRLLVPDPTDPWSLEIANEILFMDPPILRALADRLSRDLAPATETMGPSAGPSAPGAAARQVLRARLTWWAGRGEEALVILRQAVAAHPDAAVARSALGEAYQEIAHAQDLALVELERAAEIDPSRPAAGVDLALALLRAGRSKQAAAAARRCLERSPDLAPAQSVLGAALADQGDFEGAASAYAAALSADPADNFGLARGQLPVALAALGRNVEARRALRGPLPPLPEMLYREAWAFARDSCRDRGFNGQDWLAWRTRYRRKLGTEDDAYRAITEMLASLGDPYTRLRDPEETASLFLARRGASVLTDPLGRVSPPSKTVITGDLPGGLGYIRLSNFTDPNVVAELRAALETMRQKEGIVLDLRGNSGGLTRSADEIGNLLVGPGRDAGVDDSAAGPITQVTGGEGALTDSPLTVLVDGQTGSAAERLARTLSSTGRGSLAGDPTFGKGRAQVSRVLPGGTTVLVSISEMLGPDGRPIQGNGLQPARRARVPPVSAAAEPSPGAKPAPPPPAAGSSPAPPPAANPSPAPPPR